MGASIREVLDEGDDYHDNHGNNDMMAIACAHIITKYCGYIRDTVS